EGAVVVKKQKHRSLLRLGLGPHERRPGHRDHTALEGRLLLDLLHGRVLRAADDVANRSLDQLSFVGKVVGDVRLLGLRLAGNGLKRGVLNSPRTDALDRRANELKTLEIPLAWLGLKELLKDGV